MYGEVGYKSCLMLVYIKISVFCNNRFILFCRSFIAEMKFFVRKLNQSKSFEYYMYDGGLVKVVMVFKWCNWKLNVMKKVIILKLQVLLKVFVH